ncbi:MAG: acyltransferase, partial [Candidatus Obscuribacterales bacterium]|nr:acyltransferase [Candidatus Obscuribacterales bacterium]
MIVVLHLEGWRAVGESFNLSQATSFFFVFSGFILACNYSKLDGNRETLWFYLSRFSRIWPSHALSLFLLILLLPEVFKVTKSQLPLFFCNLFLVQSWIPCWKLFFSYNAPTWTCSTLIVMYLCFPLLIRAMRSCWYIVVILAVAAVLISIFICNLLQLPESSPTGWSSLGMVYIHPACRTLEFVVGIASALLFSKYERKISAGLFVATILELGIVMIIICLSYFSATIRASSIVSLSNAGALWVANSGIPLIPSAVLIMLFALQRGLISKLLSLPIFIFLGEISFSMFLLHGIFLAFHGVRYASLDSSYDAFLFVA